MSTIPNVKDIVYKSDVARLHRFYTIMKLPEVLVSSLQDMEESNNQGIKSSGLSGLLDTVDNALDLFDRIKNGPEAERTLTAMCSGVTWPGRTLATIQPKTSGPRRTMPFASVTDVVSMTFLCSSDLFEKRVFEAWVDNIVNHKTGRLNYYNSYIGEATIIQYDGNGKVVDASKLVELYPVRVQGIESKKEENNEFHRLTVDFAYRYHEKAEDSVLNSTYSTQVRGHNGSLIGAITDIANGDIGSAIRNAASVAVNGINLSDEGAAIANRVVDVIGDSNLNLEGVARIVQRMNLDILTTDNIRGDDKTLLNSALTTALQKLTGS